MIRLLLVEDHDLVIDQVRGWMAEISPDCEILIEGDRDGAISCLESVAAEFDLIVCDLNIPPHASSIDGREEYGLQVHEVARLRHPGTPCLFFTGHADDIDTHDQLSNGPVEDVFGSGVAVPLVRLFRKLRAAQARAAIAGMCEEIDCLDEITLDIRSLTLLPFEQRAVRIFARRHHGARAVLEPLGGLSGAKTFRMTVYDAENVRRALVFGKVTERNEVQDEEHRFQQFVSVHLDPARLPVLAGHVISGAGRQAALYYSLADRYDRSLFSVIKHDEGEALRVLANLRVATDPWHSTGMSREVNVGDLRRLGLSDDAMTGVEHHLDSVAWREVEALTFNSSVGPQHGDLHGANVLVDPQGEVMLIDFGDVDRRPLGLDPVILELSLYFHPGRPQAGVLLDPDLFAGWADLDGFTRSIGVPAVVRACRRWALDAAGSELPVLCLAYAHAVRQLKYPGTDKAVAAAIVLSIANRLLDMGSLKTTQDGPL